MGGVTHKSELTLHKSEADVTTNQLSDGRDVGKARIDSRGSRDCKLKEHLMNVQRAVRR